MSDALRQLPDRRFRLDNDNVTDAAHPANADHRVTAQHLKGARHANAAQYIIQQPVHPSGGLSQIRCHGHRIHRTPFMRGQPDFACKREFGQRQQRLILDKQTMQIEAEQASYLRGGAQRLRVGRTMIKVDDQTAIRSFRGLSHVNSVLALSLPASLRILAKSLSRSSTARFSEPMG